MKKLQYATLMTETFLADFLHYHDTFLNNSFMVLLSIAQLLELLLLDKWRHHKFTFPSKINFSLISMTNLHVCVCVRLKLSEAEEEKCPFCTGRTEQ